MKKFALMLCLLFTISIGMIHAQTSQAPASIPGNDNSYTFTLPADPMVTPAAPADLTITPPQADKLTMVSSPNPFTSRTEITCVLPVKGKLTLVVRNMFGETVRTIEENVEQEGTCSMEVTSEHLRPGIYTAILVLKTSDNVMMKTIRIVYNQ
jgi:hypothetical protein